MPWVAICERERLVLVDVALLRLRGQHAVRAGPQPSRGWRPVVSQRRVAGLDRVDLLNDAVGDVEPREPAVAGFLGALQRLGDRAHDLGGAAGPERSVVP